MIAKTIYQLKLDCGHTAFAFESEEHILGRPRPCHACSTHVAWADREDGDTPPPAQWEKIVEVIERTMWVTEEPSQKRLRNRVNLFRRDAA